MSDVSEAAERLRRCAMRILGDTSDAVWCGNDDIVKDDAKWLANAYLREHLVDDETLIDEAFLRSVGGIVRQYNGFMFGPLFVFKSGCGWCALYGSMKMSEAWDVAACGDVRRLCVALGIQLNG